MSIGQTMHPRGEPARSLIFHSRRGLAALALGALVASAGCKVTEDGTIPCVDDSSCPADYPVCGSAGKCVAAGSAQGDAGSAAGTVAITGVEGHAASDVVSGTVTIDVVAQSPSGVLSVTLAAGSAVLMPDANPVKPLYRFDYPTSGAGDVQLIATMTPGDPSQPDVTSAPFTLHVDNDGPVLTLGPPSPSQARPGEMVTASLTASKPLATLGGHVFLAGTSSNPIGAVAIVSGVLGTDTDFVLGVSVPLDAASGDYQLVATATDAAGNGASSTPADFTVQGAFTLGEIAVTSSATESGQPAGKLGSPIHASVQVPLTTALGADAATFTLVDAAGHSRALGGNVTVTQGASAQTLSIDDAIAAGDASGPARIDVVVTDVADNSASGSASLVIDQIAPYLISVAPDLAAADPTRGTPAGTVHVSGTASEPLTAAAWSIVSGGTGSGACTCDGASCAGDSGSAPLVSCAIPVPAVSSVTAIVVAVALTDLAGNVSSASSDRASFDAVPLPHASSLTPIAVSITTGTSTNLTPTFTGGSGVVTNDRDGSVFNVTSGTPFTVSPTQRTTYSLIVTNAVGTVFSPAPTAVVTVSPPVSFGVTYVPASGAPTPGAMVAGASTGTLTFSVPDLTGFVSAQILDATGAPVVLASGGAAVTSSEIFNAQGGAISGVQIPTTRASDSRTLNYTLQATNAGNGNSDFLAPLVVTPVPAVTGGVSLTPSAISGGSTAPLTLSLPVFSGTTQSVSFTAPGGLTLLNASGTPLTSEELIEASGSTLQVRPPTSLGTDPAVSDVFTLSAANGAGAATATTTLNIYPLPVLAAATFAATPSSITGATSGTLQLALPALTSPNGSAAGVTLTVGASGGAQTAVTKASGGAIAVSDLGTTVTVNFPSTGAAQDGALVYTLTVANAAATPATTTATSTLQVIPQPVLASTIVTPTPSIITAGSAAPISLALPALSSGADSASAIALSITWSGGTSAVTKADGSQLALGDLGSTIQVLPPAAAITDDESFLYTLTVSNAAATPATATATATIDIVPQPVLAASSFTLTPAILSGGGSTGPATTLPALTSPAATPANAVGMTVACGSGAPVAINKSNGSALALSDLGQAVTLAAPATSATEDDSCTYVLSVVNAAGASANASGTVQIVPAPALSGSLTIAPTAITGGSASALSFTLPAQSSPAATPANSVALAVNCGSGSSGVTKSDGSALGLGDLGSTISVNPPSSTSASNLSCAYTLTLTNAAGAAATKGATLNILPQPTLTSGALTLSIGDLTGGAASTFTIRLPSVTSAAPSLANTVALAVNCGSGSTGVTKSGGGAIGVNDLGTTVTVADPASSATDNKACTYTLTVSNAATTPASATATGTLHVEPAPTLGASSFTAAPAVITGGTSPAIAVTLPSQSSPAASPDVNSASMTVACGGGAAVAAAKSGGGAISLSDLGTAVSLAAPTTTSTTNQSCVYTLTLANAAGSTATATSTINVVPVPTLASSTLSPSATNLAGGATTAFTLPLPAVTSGAATPANSASLSYDCGSGATTAAKSGGGAVGLGDLGTPVSLAPPASGATDNKTCTYTLTLTNAATTPVSATATAILYINPTPVLSAGTMSASPSAITGGTSAAISVTLPSVTSATPVGGKANTAAMTIGCTGHGTVAATKSAGGAVGLGDLGGAVSLTPPATAATDDETCTYTLTVTSPGGATATATSAITVVPQPAFSSGALGFSIPAIAGDASAGSTFNVTLPSLSVGSGATPANTVAFKVNCGSGAVAQNKAGGSAVAPGDLGTTIAVNPPAGISATSNLQCNYTLTVSNAAATPAPATAAGELDVVPTPALAASSFTPSPVNVKVNASTSVSLPLPALSSAAQSGNTASLQINCGAGSSAVNKAAGGAIGMGDLGTTVTVNGPNLSSAATCTYTLQAASEAGETASATATLNVLPTPVWNSGFDVSPDAITTGTSTAGLLQFTLPTLSVGAATGVALTQAGAAVNKTGGGAVGAGDLGSTISVDPPSTSGSATQTFTYLLTATNAAGDTASVSTVLAAFPPKPALHSNRFGASATLLNNGKILIAGGGTGLADGVCTGAVNSAELYDPSTGVSTAIASTMVHTRCDHTASLINGVVYLAGGSSSMQIDQYNVATNTFAASAALDSMQTTRFNHTATVVTNSGTTSVIFIGGYTTAGATPQNTIELYTPGNDATTNSHTLESARAQHTATLIGNLIYVIGGSTSTGTTSGPKGRGVDMVSTTSANGSVTSITDSGFSASTARIGGAAVQISDSGGSHRIMVIGGTGADGTLLTAAPAIQIYTVSGTMVSAGAGSAMTQGLARFSALLTNDASKVLVFGGSTAFAVGGDTGSNVVYAITPTTAGTVTSYATMQDVRQDATAVDFSSSSLVNSNTSVFLVPGGGASGSSADVVAATH